MKAGIVSDTHGDAGAWRQLWHHCFDGIQLVLHAGDVLYHGPRNSLPSGYDPGDLGDLIRHLDVPFIWARGNCDAEVDFSVLDIEPMMPWALTELDGVCVMVHHGDRFPDNRAVLPVARRLGAAMVISGHTHCWSLTEEEEVWFFNPGSPSLPKGDPPVATVGVWEDGVLSCWDIVRKKLLAQQRIA